MYPYEALKYSAKVLFVPQGMDNASEVKLAMWSKQNAIQVAPLGW